MADVTWSEASWITSILIAILITVVGITFFSIIILTSISLYRLRVLQKLFWNFVLSFVASFLNLFLLFGAVFAFPAVVINSIFVTVIYAYDLRKQFYPECQSPSLLKRYFLYLSVAIVATILGACLIKYTPGILHKAGEVPPLDWQKDFQTWEGLGGWIFVNIAFGSVSLLVGSGIETWVYRKDFTQYKTAKKNC